METVYTASSNTRGGDPYGIPLRNHLNQYEILRTLGRGTHGKVELARNVKTDKLVVSAE
jgi:serine/threonine protein kinase